MLYSGLGAGLFIDQSIEDDELRIFDTASTVTINTGAAADKVRIQDLSHATTLVLGDGDDVIRLRDVGALLAIDATGGGADTLVLDRRSLRDAVSGRIFDAAGSTTLAGFTSDPFTTDGFERIRVELGDGNDLVEIDTSTEAELFVMGGIGDDTVTVKQIGSVNETVVTGDSEVDTVWVVIDAVPTPEQFEKLSLGVEVLIIDNRTNEVRGVAWTEIDGAQIFADVGAGNTDALILPTLGAEVVRVLGGTEEDSLAIITTTPCGHHRNHRRQSCRAVLRLGRAGTGRIDHAVPLRRRDLVRHV